MHTPTLFGTRLLGAGVLGAGVLGACMLLVACGGGGSASNNTQGAQSALGGMGEGPAPKKSGGVQNPGNTSGDNPQGETSPSGPGTANSTG